MQSTGQASTQAVSFVPMQGSAITYAIDVVFPDTYTYHTSFGKTILQLRTGQRPHQTGKACQPKFEKPFFLPPGWAPASCPRPKPPPKRCCRLSTSRSSSTASKRRC